MGFTLISAAGSVDFALATTLIKSLVIGMTVYGLDYLRNRGMNRAAVADVVNN